MKTRHVVLVAVVLLVDHRGRVGETASLVSVHSLTPHIQQRLAAVAGCWSSGS